MSQTIFGNALTVYTHIAGQSDDEYQHYQNFSKQPILLRNHERDQTNLVYSSFSYVPFGFSGITVTRTGDGVEGNIIFPYHNLIQSWIKNSIDLQHIASVQVLSLTDDYADDDPEISPNTPSEKIQVLTKYTGKIMTGSWNSSQIVLKLGSVLDAVGGDLPRRYLTSKSVGDLPVSNVVSLR